MDEAEEYYERKYREMEVKLSDDKILAKIDGHLKKISKLVDCGVEINFIIMPHVENYEEIQERDDYEIPEFPTMKLKHFIEHLKKEDGEMDVYVDPIYLKKGVNAIVDVLITTTEEKMIIVPIAIKK
jgi:hypothetical protein